MDERTRGASSGRSVKSWATALALVSVTVGLVVARPAEAAKPGVPTLESVNISGVPAYSNVRCNPDGTSSFDYEVSGTASGSYTGTFTEQGHVTIGPQGRREQIDSQLYEVAWTTGYVAGLEATFSITSPSGTVTGTRTLTESGLGACQTSVQYRILGVVAEAPALMLVADGTLAYRATIATGRRVYCERGRSFTKNGVAEIGPPVALTLQPVGYRTAFSSDLRSPEPRRGHDGC
jgi:hypothetical protein